MILCVTGMHRSGTSLVAHVVNSAGFFIGERIMDPAHANPRGFYEDLDFFDFHEAVMKRRKLKVFLTEPFKFIPSDDEFARAREILRRRDSKQDWAWKDPRTSLFLPFWDSLIPDCRYLLLFRCPYDVVLSLLHRARNTHIGQVHELFACWKVYNDCLLSFTRKCRQSVLLCSIDALVRDFGRFQGLFERRFGRTFDVDERAFNEVYCAGELSSPVIESGLWPTLREVPGDCMEVYAALQELADMPAPEHPSAKGREECSNRRLFFFDRPSKASEGCNGDGRRALILLSLLVDSASASAALRQYQKEPANVSLEEQAKFRLRVFEQAASEIAESALLKSANREPEEVRVELARTNRQLAKRLSDSEASNRALLAALRDIYRRTARLHAGPDDQTFGAGTDWSGLVEALLKEPEYLLAYAAELRQRGRMEEALRIAEQCVKICRRKGDPSGIYFAALYMCASVLKQTGDSGEAYRRFASLSRLRKTRPPDQFLGGAYFHMARLREEEGRRAHAVRLLRRCLHIIPDHGEASRMLESMRKNSTGQSVQ